MILGTEVNEFVSNRQQSKIYYLSEENKYLQEYVADLENALKLNKQAMQLTMDGINKKPQLISDNSTMSVSCGYQNTQYENVIKLLNEENTKLMKALSNQQKIASQLQTKLLLQDQIAEEQQNYYKDLIGDLEYKLIDLKRNIHDKEYAIQELERMKPIQEKEGQLVKVIEVVTPSEQNLKLHEEIENVRNLLSKITQEAQNVTETNNLLKEVNYVNPNLLIINLAFKKGNIQNENCFKKLSQLYEYEGYKIQFDQLDFVYNEYVEKVDDNLDLNREIYNHRGKLEQVHQELYGTNSLGYGFSPEPQQLKYLSKNERMIYQEKLHKMEMMVKGFKELFEKEKNTRMSLINQYNEISKKYDSVLDTNELLIKSNTLKDQRNDKLQIELSFYKKQSSQLMEQLRSRKLFNVVSLNQEQDIAVGIFSPRFTVKSTKHQSQQSYFKSQQTNPDELEPKNSSRQINTSNSKIYSGIIPYQQSTATQQTKPFIKPQLQPLEIDDDSQIEQVKYCQTARGDAQQLRKQTQQQQQGQIMQYYDMSKEECINFLMSLNYDFFKNFDLNNVKKQQLMKQMKNDQFQEEIKKPLKKSYSNPFLYFSNINQINYSKPPKQSVLAITKNEIKVLLDELQTKKKNTDNLDVGNDLFSVDISKIDIKAKKKEIIEEDASFISNSEIHD